MSKKFKVFPHRLHTAGGHVVQVYSEYSTPAEILDYLKDQDLVDIFWTQSTHGSLFVPLVIRGKSIEIVAPVFGRSGLVVERDNLGNVTTNLSADSDEPKQVTPGQSAKKRK